MTDELIEKEKAKYESMWNVPSYRITSPGFILAEAFFDFFTDSIKPNDSITDYGCGTGFAALSFLEKELKVHLIDIASNSLADKIAALTLFLSDRIHFTEACLWSLPDTVPSSDWCYCMDVLEHIPTEKVDEVLHHIAKRTKKGGALQVFLKDEPFGNLIGDTLHLTIQPLSWWLEKIAYYFTIKEVASIIPDVRYTIFVESKD